MKLQRLAPTVRELHRALRDVGQRYKDYAAEQEGRERRMYNVRLLIEGLTVHEVALLQAHLIDSPRSTVEKPPTAAFEWLNMQAVIDATSADQAAVDVLEIVREGIQKHGLLVEHIDLKVERPEES
jgi:hypothetical protein